jgi:hypothetical protein
MSEINEEVKQQQLVTQTEAPMGFEDENDGDLIVPRVKIINALSPERKDKIADEGDILNSLTKEKLNGKIFIPVFKFDNNIRWIPRDEGGGIACVSRDGKCGVPSDGSASLICKSCGLNEFDNTKTGKEAQPKCTKYFNFFGFFSGEPMPIILSFAKTNYAEGKKLFSLAKVTMQNMWHFGYALEPKAMSKAGNDWFNVVVKANGKTTDDDREYGRMLYQAYRNQEFKFDEENDVASDNSEPQATASADDVAKAEF